MKKISTLISFLCLAAGMSAQPSLKKIESLPVVDKIGNISVLSAEHEGTAFVTGSGRGLRVLGRSETTYTKGMELPEGFRLWLEAASAAIDAPTDAAETHVKPVAIDPLIKTKWNQDVSPYFNKCPQVSLKRTVVGCTATSMAQILKFYEYPARGEGDCTYYISKTVAGQESVTEKKATLSDSYNYSLMLDSYSGGYTPAQGDAVATLMRDCGYATAMTYGRDGSSASYVNAAHGLIYNFGYNDRSLQFRFRDYYTDGEWLDLIYQEIIDGRPLMYAGVDTVANGAHSFIFDGLLPDGMVHINWGWGGSMDGYYDINVMADRAAYTAQQYMLYGIKPEKATENTPYEYVPEIILDAPELSVKNDTLLFTGGIFNYDFRDLKGEIAMVFVDVEKQDSLALYFMQEEYENEAGVTEPDSLPSWRGWRFGEGYNDPDISQYILEGTDEDEPLKPGSYEVFFGYCASFEGDDVIHKARTIGGEWFANFTYDEAGHFTVTNPSATVTGVEHVIQDLPAPVVSAQPRNLLGQRVGAGYHGIVIENGKKTLR